MQIKRNINNIRIIFLVIACILFASCEKTIEWNITGKSNLRLVVEGSITNEKKFHSVKLTLPVQSLNESPRPASGAMVVVSENSNIWSYHEKPENSGIYYSDSAFVGGISISYNLHITYGDFECSATTFMVPITPMEALNIESVIDSSGFYTFQYTESRGVSMLEVNIDWSGLGQYQNIDTSKRKVKLIYYTLSSIDVSKIFKPDKEKVYFPSGTVIIRKKYSLNQDEEKFIRSLMLETDWKGSKFDVLPSNVYTNLSEGAAGYFGAYTVVSDSVVY